MSRPGRLVLAGAIAALLTAPAPAWGQERSGFHPRWEIPGFDIHPDGGWRVRSRAVAQWRRQLQSRGDFQTLNAPTAGAALRFAAPQGGAAVSGVIRVPAVLFSYQGVDSAVAMRNPALYQGLLFGAGAPPGLPYSFRSFYAELSNNLLDVQGQVVGWVRLDSAESSYNGGQSSQCQLANPWGTTNCHGFWSGFARQEMQAGLRQALAKADASIDFRQFDNDGGGAPNDGNDDGIVDVVAFIHATRDGACGGPNHIWAHRSALATPYITNDTSSFGQPIRIRDYIVQTGLGGAGGCDSLAIMAIGTMAHEFGHVLGLPDLYDLSDQTEGVGQWSLMSSSYYTTQFSPGRLDPWSLNELGWLTLRHLTVTGTYNVGPAPTGDTTFLVRPTVSNPRGEYFLIENRQAVLADTAMIRIHCAVSGNPPGCGGGLLVWHVDSIKANGPGNVNTGPIHGVRLIQADGLNHLDNTSPPVNRGDGGDPYPGTTGNTALGFSTTPRLASNFDSSFLGFAFDSIRQVVPNGEMAFRLRFGGLTVVRASDTTASVIVEGDTTRRFADLLANGEQMTIEAPDSQVAPDGRSRHAYLSWSDGGARVHQITGSAGDSTIVANVQSEYLLQVAGGPGGTLTSSHPVAPGGSFFFRDSAVTLTPLPNAGFEFGSWNGDTVALDSVLVLGMRRPYSVTACFQTAMSIPSAMARPAGVMGVSYADTLQLSAVPCRPPQWLLVTGILPVGLTLNIQGRIAGIPAQTGVFPFRARATAGRTVIEKDFTLTVTAPTLATAAVVGHLLGGSGLTSDELRYLDLLGNKNSQFDVGDFLAWVNVTGAPLTAQAATYFSAALLGRTR